MATNTTARLADQATIAAYSAGFRGRALIDWVAIALAESRGNINAQGDQSLRNSTWGNSVGLWQVRSMNSHRGRWDGRNYVRDANRLTDPFMNAQAAWVISNRGTNKRPWSVTHAGKPNSYRNFLNTARESVNRVMKPGASDMNNEGRRVLSRMRSGNFVGGTVPSSASSALRNASSTETLRLGSRGERVKELQRQLKRQGGDSRLVVDGIYGRETAAAVRRWQRKTRLLIDGRAGPQTLGSLGINSATSGWENRVGGVSGVTRTEGFQGATSGWENRVGGVQSDNRAIFPGLGDSPIDGGGSVGTSISGGGSGGAPLTGPGSGQPLSASELREYIAETYPQMLWALDHPELGPILKEAAEEGWSAGRMYGKLIQTTWWKSNPESARALQQVKNNDPATWQQMLGAKRQEFIDMARQLGMPVNGRLFNRLQEDALTEGWTASQMREQLLGNWSFGIGDLRGGHIGGQAGQIYQTVRDMPTEYLMNLPSSDIVSWTEKILRGRDTVENFETYLRNLSRTQMPFLKVFIDQGLTPKQALAAHQQQIANVLEVDEEEVDFAKPNWQGLLTNDDGTLASSIQTRQYARERMPELWDKTDQARSTAARMTQDLAQMFGRR